MGFVVFTSCANSGVLVFPSTIAPAARSRSTQMESSSGTSCSRIFEPNVVRIPRVKMLSLTTTGTPSSGRVAAPPASRRSTASASSSAFSFRVQMAFRVGLTASTRASIASATSRALTLRSATARAMRAAERPVMSWSNASLLTIGGRPEGAVVHGDHPPREPPFPVPADDRVVVGPDVAQHRRIAGHAVIAVEIAPPAHRVLVDGLEPEAAVPVAADPVPAPRLVPGA